MTKDAKHKQAIEAQPQKVSRYTETLYAGESVLGVLGRVMGERLTGTVTININQGGVRDVVWKEKEK